MPLSEIQAALPLLAQLLLIAVIGALLVGSFFAVIGFVFRNALWVVAILGVGYFLWFLSSAG